MYQKLDSKIDFSTVVTREKLKTLTDEEVNFVKKEGLSHSRYLRNAYNPETLKSLLTTRAKEIAFVGYKYKDLNPTAQELLAATIVFPDDESFIKCLLSRNINYNLLFNYSRAVSSIKKVALLAKNLEIDEDVKLTSKKINTLCSLIRIYFGIRDYNLILAKINEIVLFKKDLYKKLEQEQFTPDSKTR